MSGAVALVTGASSGIGAAAAGRLAAVGARVFVTGRDPDRLAEVAGRTAGTALAYDLTRPDRAAELAARVLSAAGRIDILVNNAGQGWAGPLVGMTDAEIVDLVTVNLTAPMLLTRAALPGMLSRGRGHLGFVGSIAGRLGVREEAAYSAAKAGLGVFAESLRQEVAGRGVVVTELVPGVVATRFFDRRGRPYQRRSPRPVPAERAADVLLAALLAGRDEAYLPGWLRLPVALRGALPRAYRALAGRYG
ncbi:SDR family NAD(P)-dependent oxidoreductase [Micromonospora zhanjiangensis]